MRVFSTGPGLWKVVAVMVAIVILVLWQARQASDSKSVNDLLAEMRSYGDARSAAEVKLKVAGPRAVPDLIKAMDRRNPRYQDDYNELRRRLPGFLLSVLPESHDRAVDRENAVQILASFGPEARPALPKMIQLLDDGHWRVRLTVINAFGDLGSTAKDATPYLLLLVKTNEPYDRALAARSLWKVDPIAHEKIACDAALSVIGTHYLSTETAIQVLDEMGAVDLAVPLLIHSLAATNRHARRVEAAMFLGRLGAKAKSAVPLLTEALCDEALGLRSAAAAALGDIGPDARSALPLLYEAACEQQPYSGAFDSAIARIEDRPIVPMKRAPRRAKRPLPAD